jgi:hypothetical protein
MNTKTKTNLILDLSIFSAFLAIANPHLTGMTIHEWLALAFVAATLVHLLFHWDWIVSVGKTFFKKLMHQSRLNFVVNVIFLVTMAVTMLSGLLISKSILATFGITLNVDHSWETLHKLTADWALIALGLHFALHLKWLGFNLKRYLITPVARLFTRPKQTAHGQLVARPVRVSKK